jgi:hypothetical protein
VAVIQFQRALHCRLPGQSVYTGIGRAYPCTHRHTQRQAPRVHSCTNIRASTHGGDCPRIEFQREEKSPAGPRRISLLYRRRRRRRRRCARGVRGRGRGLRHRTFTSSYSKVRAAP